jgi:hypothetical protein
MDPKLHYRRSNDPAVVTSSEELKRDRTFRVFSIFKISFNIIQFLM